MTATVTLDLVSSIQWPISNLWIWTHTQAPWSSRRQLKVQPRVIEPTGRGKLTSMLPALGKLATVLTGTLNGADMPQKHYILGLFLPKEILHKRSSMIYFLLILCRENFKTNKEFVYPTEICCNGIWPVQNSKWLWLSLWDRSYFLNCIFLRRYS